jgi:uncharacterized protein
MESIWLLILAGAGVGFTIGLTGIGGGSLMTPLLLLFGYPPQIAVGTDLLYASITKGSGVVVYAKQHSVRWDIVKYMSAGSLPAMALTIWLLSKFDPNLDNYEAVFMGSIGIMLIGTALTILFRNRLFARSENPNKQGLIHKLQAHRRLTVFISGIVLGVLITISSIGAGVIGTTILLLLYPVLRSSHIVGTELAHAVPLTLFAGFGHVWLGHVDFNLLAALLIGSLPATYMGAMAGKRLPEQLMRPVLAVVLLVIGVKCTFF